MKALLESFSPTAMGSAASCPCCTIVPEGHVRTVESFGKFAHFSGPGCTCLNPFTCPAASEGFSLKLKQCNATVSTKTTDNCLLKISITALYQPHLDKLYTAYYSLTDVDEQMRAIVTERVRVITSSLTFSEVYNDNKWTFEVKDGAHDSLAEYGWEVHNVLITQIQPAEGVKSGMANMVQQRIFKTVTNERADMDKVWHCPFVVPHHVERATLILGFIVHTDEDGEDGRSGSGSEIFERARNCLVPSRDRSRAL